MNPNQGKNVEQGARRWLVRETLGNLILIALLFGIAGQWDWWMGWALSGIYIFWSIATAVLILPVNPEMLAERAHPHADNPKWDKILLGIMGLMMILEYVIAGLDQRLSWSQQFSPLVQFMGLAAAIFGYDFMLVWAMTSNAFFIATVRIQTDRQHSVVSSGPYRYVRHPGYLGTILLHLGVPFMLNSLWAIIPGVGAALALIIRTMYEDRMLRSELPGYERYAERVRFRLVPRLW